MRQERTPSSGLLTRRSRHTRHLNKIQIPKCSDGVQHAEEQLEHGFQRETSRDDLVQLIIVNLKNL